MGVRSLDQAITVFEEQLGLAITVSPEDPNRHGRLFLNRSYVEVSVQADAEDWSVPLFFLGFNDPDALRAHLDKIGFQYQWGEYVGVDGTWDNVELAAREVPLPILVRRVSPVEIAADWPPALHQPHRCGAITLATIHLTVPELGPAQDVYSRLLGAEQNLIKLVEGDDVGVSALVFNVRSYDETRNELGDILSDRDKDGVSWVRSAVISRVRLGFLA